jgi:hypothetical protein
MRYNECQFILITVAIYQEKITSINTYAPNFGTPSFIKQTLLDTKAQVDSNTIIVCDFNTLLSPIDR